MAPIAIEDRPTERLQIETMGDLVGGRSQNVFFSRIPGEEVPAPIPPSPELVSIHAHLVEDGRLLVIEWAWDEEIESWTQLAVVNVPNITNAREYVPPKFERIIVPPEFGIEMWRSL